MNEVATLWAAGIAFAVTTGLGFVFIPFLRKLKYGQTILEIGPSWHKNKQGTPTMGGLMFAVGIVAAAVAAFSIMQVSHTVMPDYATVENARFWGTIMLALSCGFIGFIDDYVKVVKKRNLGLTASQKLVLQFAAASAYLALLYFAGDTSTAVVIPFLGQINLGLLYYPLCILGIVYITNSVNLTDGVDGLCASVTCVVALGFLAISAMLGFGGMNALAGALAAGCIGFLVWNFYPAKVFMGDTGSMFLGGMVVGLAFGVGMPLILGLVGIIYIAESLSVVLQVISFKSTGKRIFKMSPIHHHFEMCGHSETRIVFAFCCVTAVGCALAVLAVQMM